MEARSAAALRRLPAEPAPEQQGTRFCGLDGQAACRRQAQRRLKTEAARKVEKPSTGRDRVNFEYRARRITRENDAAGFWRSGAGMGISVGSLPRNIIASAPNVRPNFAHHRSKKRNNAARAANRVMELDHAAIGAQDLSVDPGAVPTSEEGNGSGDIFRATEAFKRVHRRHAGD